MPDGHKFLSGFLIPETIQDELVFESLQIRLVFFRSDADLVAGPCGMDCLEEMAEKWRGRRLSGIAGQQTERRLTSKSLVSRLVCPELEA